jgi:hypothetical protein
MTNSRKSRKSIHRRRAYRSKSRSPLESRSKQGNVPGHELGILGAVLGVSAMNNNNNDNDSKTPYSLDGAVDSIPDIIMGGAVSRSLDVSVLILAFMEMLNTIKIYHWSTLSYPSHKATDELHSKMSELTDSFIEQYIGGVGGGKIPVFRGSRNHSIPFCECKSLEQFKKKLLEFKTLLVTFTERLEGVSELLNIRDEMLGAIDQAVYLLRLTK